MKILQFGEGNFLRTFVDLYFDTLNKEESGKYEVTIVKSVPFGSLEQLRKQNHQYHIVLRGKENGLDVENIYHVDSVKNSIDLFEMNNSFFSTAEDEEYKIIISNTTEAGITFDKNDKMENYPNVTYPAKLTMWLYHRYKAHKPGVYILPVELIDNNAKELEKCVNQYIELFNLGDEFKTWNQENNFYCSTLVDRIVSGHPRDNEVESHLYNLIGQVDPLLSIGEPFGLWVIEDKGDIKRLLKDGHHNIDVIFTKDITYYKKRKVRVLNGSHTNLVPISLWMGKETVYDVMKDSLLEDFVNKTLVNDIIPFVSDDIEMTTKFADDVKQRFLNPFLNHQLTSIALNSISKWKARDLCSFVDYYTRNKSIPTYLTIGFAYLVNMYMNIEKVNDTYICHLPTRTIEVRDDIQHLEYFKSHTVHEFLSDVSIWDLDLTEFKDLEKTVNKYLSMIKNNERII